MISQETINSMRQIAERLKVWFQKCEEDKQYPSGTVPLRLRNGISLELELNMCFNQVLAGLFAAKQNRIGDILKKERDVFLSNLEAVEQAIDCGDNPPLPLIELLSKMTHLIGTLEDTARTIEKGLKARPIELILQNMTPTQRRRYKLYLKGKTFTEIARLEGVCVNVIHKSIKSAKKRAGKRLQGVKRG